MKVARTSPRTGKVNEMELDITDAQLQAYATGTMIQDAFPNLSPEEREFFHTGYTPEDWNILFPPEDQDETSEEDLWDEGITDEREQSGDVND